MVYQTEKNLSEYKDRVNPDDVKKLEAGIEEIRNALKTDNTAEIKGATEKLNSVWQDVAQRMYQSAANEQPQEATGTEGAGGGASGSSDQEKPGGKDSKVVDADYEIVEDEGESPK